MKSGSHIVWWAPCSRLVPRVNQLKLMGSGIEFGMSKTAVLSRDSGWETAIRVVKRTIAIDNSDSKTVLSRYITALSHSLSKLHGYMADLYSLSVPACIDRSIR